MTLANPLSWPSVLQDSSYEATHLADLHPHAPEQYATSRQAETEVAQLLPQVPSNLLRPNPDEVHARLKELVELDKWSREEAYTTQLAEELDERTRDSQVLAEQVEMCKGDRYALVMYKGNLLAPDALPSHTEVLRRPPQLKEAESSSKEEVRDDCYSLLFDLLPPDLELHLEDPCKGNQHAPDRRPPPPPSSPTHSCPPSAAAAWAAPWPGHQAVRPARPP